MNPTQIKQNVIVLTRDPVQLEKLRRKHAEYEQRRAKDPSDADSVYKAGLLGKLLEKQVLDPEEEERAYAVYAWHIRKDFWNAISVITSYNTGDLSHISPFSPGTGLR